MDKMFDPIFLNTIEKNNICRYIHTQENAWKHTHQKVNSSSYLLVVGGGGKVITFLNCFNKKNFFKGKEQ